MRARTAYVPLAYATALALLAVSLASLFLPSAFAHETAMWRVQALAQARFDAAISAPAIALATWLASGGSRRALPIVAGVLLYAVYTLVIYCFAIHLNALFLLYCAALGTALFALISVATHAAPAPALAPAKPHRAIGVFLITLGAVFAALWLTQLVPTLRSGTPPPEVTEAGLLTNPVHVLDLSFVLPLYVIAGIALLRGRPLASLLAPALLAFGILMSGSIAFAAGGPVAIAMTVIAAASAVSLHRLRRST